MKGRIDKLKSRYAKIQARYKVLDKRDGKGRSIYTYSNLVEKLSEEFDYQERTISEILLLNLDEWEAKRMPKNAPPAPPQLFDTSVHTP